jgi:tetratricopeptide (TPR) repeat protein
MLREAQALARRGQGAEARGRLEAILAAAPGMAEARFLLAQLLLQAGEAAPALAQLEQAAALRPNQPAIWQLAGRAAAALKDPEASARLLRQAKRARIDRALLLRLQDQLNPGPRRTQADLGSAPPAEVQRAIALLQKGALAEAAALAGRLHRAHPKVALIADIHASALGRLGRAAEAERAHRLAVRLDPDYAEARANLGRFLLYQGRLAEAVEALSGALERLPDLPAALIAMGQAQARLGHAAAAETALRRALELAPDAVPARLELAEVLLAQRPAEVPEVLAPLAKTPLPNAAEKVLAARALAAEGRTEAAEEAFANAVAAAPESAHPLAAQGAFLQELGRFDEAETALRRAIALRPGDGQLYTTLYTGTRARADDPLIPEMQAAWDDPATAPGNRMLFGYALAKAMEDSGARDRVFTYLRPASDLMKARHPYDIERRERQVAQYLEMFDGVDWSREIPGATEAAPIYVTGLPRSGTTLVEQILASHPAVTGGGELGHGFARLHLALSPALGQARGRLPLDDAALADLGRQVAEDMQASVPGAAHPTDKGVTSYMLLGPLRLALPRGRLVVVHRDPRDTLLSMYRNRFAPGRHLYTYDLEQLARYYHGFRRLTDFWRGALGTAVHEIRYEDLLADPEAQVRALLAACGLDWAPECLDFHRNERRVETLSVHQVRQPLYASSMGAWRRHEKDLAGMIDLLEVQGDLAAWERGGDGA